MCLTASSGRQYWPWATRLVVVHFIVHVIEHGVGFVPGPIIIIIIVMRRMTSRRITGPKETDKKQNDKQDSKQFHQWCFLPANGSDVVADVSIAGECWTDDEGTVRSRTEKSLLLISLTKLLAAFRFQCQTQQCLLSIVSSDVIFDRRWDVDRLVIRLQQEPDFKSQGLRLFFVIKPCPSLLTHDFDKVDVPGSERNPVDAGQKT